MTKKKDKKDYLKQGRPTKYNPIYCEQLIDYFSINPVLPRDMTITTKDGVSKDFVREEAAPIPFITGFCRLIGISRPTFHEWVKAYPNFSNAYNEIKELQKEFIIVNAMRGNHNALFSIFTLKNIAGWRDKKEITGKDGGNLEVTINYAD